jgi:hypothetical protein
MHRLLRHLARRPHLRVLALLAWLMLALMPVHGAPGGMMDESHGMNQAMSMADHGVHDMTTMTADCCAGQTPHDHAATGSCHCAATCASVLPALALAGLAPLRMEAMVVPRHGAMAPSVQRSPPLRPPLQQTPRLT